MHHHGSIRSLQKLKHQIINKLQNYCNYNISWIRKKSLNLRWPTELVFACSPVSEAIKTRKELFQVLKMPQRERARRRSLILRCFAKGHHLWRHHAQLHGFQTTLVNMLKQSGIQGGRAMQMSPSQEKRVCIRRVAHSNWSSQTFIAR